MTRTPWDDFPKIVFAQILGRAKEHPAYIAAKSGDTDAAINLVNDLVDGSAIERLKLLIGHRQPIVVPVLAIESAGHNKLPVVYANKIAMELNLTASYAIIQAEKVFRTNQSSDYRLAFSPNFIGEIEAGKDYLLVDDTMAMGGTLASLRGHIEAQSGQVVGATTLTGYSLNGLGDLALLPNMYHDLWQKHGAALDDFLNQQFGYGINCLTQGEAGHYRKAATLDAIRDRILAYRDAIGR